jgi:iron-sulfur cluster assembly protein
MKNPVAFTEAAVTHIQSLMAKNPKAIGFRLAIKKTGCSGNAYVPDIIETVNPEDLCFVAQNNMAVYLDKKSLELLQDVVVDFIVEDGHGLKQKRLVFTNPNAKGQCGCGESFTVD